MDGPNTKPSIEMRICPILIGGCMAAGGDIGRRPAVAVQTSAGSSSCDHWQCCAHTSVLPVTSAHTQHHHARLQRGGQEAVCHLGRDEAKQVQQSGPHLQIRCWRLHLRWRGPGNSNNLGFLYCDIILLNIQRWRLLSSQV